MIGAEHMVLALLKTPRGRAAVGLAMLAFGAFMVCLAYPQIDSMRELKAHAVRTVADVIDARVARDAHGLHNTYDIRYRFRVQPGGRWYERCERGPLARKELWASLPKERWEQVTQAGKIDVDYLPSDPSVNEIAGEAGRELVGTYCLLGFGAALALPGIGLLVHGVVKNFSGGAEARVRSFPPADRTQTVPRGDKWE
jgi:hypothetical protein